MVRLEHKNKREPFSTVSRPGSTVCRYSNAVWVIYLSAFPIFFLVSLRFIQRSETTATCGCATYLWVERLTGRSHFPKLFPTTTELGTAERDDGIGAAQAPAHA